MTTAEFKKMARVLKALYAEAQRTALEQKLDIVSPEYEAFIEALRTETLARAGFTVDEYETAKKEYLLTRTPKLKQLIAQIDDIKKQEGPRGEQGPAGRDGVDGKDGLRGERGADGKNGRDGKDGRDGKNGRDGKDGRDGLDGKDGRDGADIADTTVGYLEDLINRQGTDFKQELAIMQEVVKGMPDFRKLGMGLQAQIDTRIEGVGVNRIIYSATEPTNMPTGTIWISPA